MTSLGMRSSMGRTGVCWDNLMAESFFSALKNERVYLTAYATKVQARRDVIAYIEGFYNSRRRHSALDCWRPNEVHYSYPERQRQRGNQSNPLPEISAAAHTFTCSFVVLGGGGHGAVGGRRGAGCGGAASYWVSVVRRASEGVAITGSGFQRRPW